MEIANALSVTLDQLMCDCLIASGDIYKNEISSLLEDCSYHEVKVIADIIHATKQSIRKNLKSNITDDIK